MTPPSLPVSNRPVTVNQLPRPRDKSRTARPHRLHAVFTFPLCYLYSTTPQPSTSSPPDRPGGLDLPQGSRGFGQPTSPCDCDSSYRHGSPAREIRTFRSRTSLSQASGNSWMRSGRLADNFWITLSTENWAPALLQAVMIQSIASSGKFISDRID